MVGLGILGDVPPVNVQPLLADGIHLRWGFRRNRGFAWFGYYLYRRRAAREFNRECLAPRLKGMKPEPLGTAQLVLPVGTITSDRNLELTDDFPSPGIPEVDLGGGRTYLAFDLPAGSDAAGVDIRVGFRDIRDERRACIDLDDIRRVAILNPLQRDGITLSVEKSALDATGALRPIMVKTGEKTLAGADAGREATVGLDTPADEVTISLSHVGPGVKAEALDARGRSLATGEAKESRDDKIQTILLRSDGSAIVQVRLITPEGRSAILGLCRGLRRTGEAALQIVALHEQVPVALQVISGKPGDIVDVTLQADLIDRIEFRPYKSTTLPDAALIELCYALISSNLRQGWEPVPDAPQPITLPLTHPDYPATGNAAEDLAAAEGEVARRVTYGDPGDYEGDNFAALHETLVRLVDGGPGGPAMSDPARAAPIPADAQPGNAAELPELAAMHPLDLVLMAAIHPAAAQILGLYWVDRTAPPGHQFDYLVIGDFNGSAIGDPMKTLSHWMSGLPEYDHFIVWNKSAGPALPLPPPSGVTAYSLPQGAVVSPQAPGQAPADVLGLVGLKWTLPLASGVLLPESAVSYHLWREAQGNDALPAAPAGLGDWLTKGGPVLVADPITNPFAEPQRPADWPDFPLHRIDRVTGEGWYAYRASGMDLFGRISPPSASFPWRQWVPPPSPLPWYYQQPPSDAQIHPSAVRVLDKTPPPAPVGVEAAILDPADPYVVRDAAHDAWRAGLPAAVRDTLVGLRVQWRWTASQIRQAPDTVEFRLYYNPGGSAPAPDPNVAANWAERVHVTAYADAVEIAGNGDRRYEVFLPRPGGAVFAAGVPLDPTLADPVRYAHVGVSAADGRQHTPDDPSWAAGAWGGRPGNEGRLGGPAKVFRVRRIPPDPPVVPADSERVYATPADYHSNSYYTYRWAPAQHLKFHVFRAMDSSVFAADRAERPRPALNANAAGVFPDPGAEPRWDAAKRAQVATELNALNGFPATPAGETAAALAYRGLSNDALRVLAGLPGTERAFAQMTLQPLDPGDPATANRPGPDNPANFPVDPGLRTYVDRLDGASTNRYFYRAAYVDGAQNRSALSLSGPPVWLPNVVAPRAVVISAVTGGDRQIRLAWASNREPDLAEYRIYRADSREAARDIRSMTRVHSIPVAAGDPAARPARVEWTDTPVPGLQNRWYAITAVDDAGNEGRPSKTVLGRAFDEALPEPPPLTATWTAAAPPAQARLVWAAAEETRIERRVLGSLQWDPVGTWRAAGNHDETIPLDATLSWRLRVRIRKSTGALAVGAAVPLNQL